MKTYEDARRVTSAELRDLTEPQVDDYFAAVDEEKHRLYMAHHKARENLHKQVGDRKHPWGGWKLNQDELEITARTMAQNGNNPEIRRTLDRIEDIEARDEALNEGPMFILGQEFRRRGGWTRAFKVTGGHVHKTTECSTCHNGEYRTQLFWKIEYSGKPEEEIVAAAGEEACTVCYPSAPVAKGLTAPQCVIFTPEELDKEEARHKREARKAEIAAAKEAKGIRDADGGPLKVFTGSQKAHQKVVRGKTVDVPAREFFDTLATLHTARGWLTDRFDSFYGDAGTHRDLDKVAQAVALKENKDAATVLKEARMRAAKRR